MRAILAALCVLCASTLSGNAQTAGSADAGSLSSGTLSAARLGVAANSSPGIQQFGAGGVYIAWGSVCTSNSTSAGVAFAGGGFPNNVFSVALGGGGGWPDGGLYVMSPIKTGFTLGAGKSGDFCAYYVAIGN